MFAESNLKNLINVDLVNSTQSPLQLIKIKPKKEVITFQNSIMNITDP